MALDVSEITSVRDQLGNEVRIGDKIAGAFRQADLAVLKTGTVEGFGVRHNWRGDDLTLKVRWETSSFTKPNGGTSQIEAKLLRFVKIGD